MNWRDIWEYQEQDYRSSPCYVENQIQLIRICLNHKGNKLRLKFSNLYGFEPLVFDKVTVQIKDGNLKSLTPKLRVMLDGSSDILLLPGIDRVLSDTLYLDFESGQILEIMTYVKEEIKITSCLVSYARLQQEVLNFEWREEYRAYPLENYELFQNALWNERMFLIYGLAGIQAMGESVTVVAFGDSLTHQGYWIDALKQRLIDERYHQVAVLNKGIGGSRLLQDTNPDADTYQRHGRAGIKRYLYDVFSKRKVNTVIIFHGINDCLTIGDQDSNELYEKIIAGLKFYAEESKLRNVKVFAATLLPNQASEMFNEKGELLRRRINAWIRENEYYNGFFDFESAVKDKTNPTCLVSEYDCGDGLHLSEQGGAAIAASIDMSMLF